MATQDFAEAFRGRGVLSCSYRRRCQTQPGSAALVVPEKPVGGQHVGKVIVVDRVLDAASNTFGVRIELPNSALALPAGLRCKVRFGEP